jgi:alkaline phosphatase D
MAGGYSTALDRRRFLSLAGAGTVAALGLASAPQAPTWSKPRFGSDPFSLGVASGDPTSDGVVLWTRLAPDPLAPDGHAGMPDRQVTVRWQVAEDPGFRKVVMAGEETTERHLGHSVHAEVRGLSSGRNYWYRFRAGDHISPVGRTRTTPAAGLPVSSYAFAFLSCQDWSSGYYTAHRHLAHEDLDAVLFLGDYIYEQGGPVSGGSTHLPGRTHAPARTLRSLADYRVRHAQYKTDANLQEAHARFPWIVTLDDHEVSNNWWNDPDPAALARRAAAFRAFWEHMPLPHSVRPQGAVMALYRRLVLGDLATIHVLDTRQYRSRQARPCAPEDRAAEGYCPEQLDRRRTILGNRQERWLLDGLSASATRWNVLANQIAFTQRDGDSDPGPRDRSFYLDGWDGYVADRQAILDHVQERDIKNLVVTTGDSHENWVLNTPPSYLDWATDAVPVATEFMVTSVTSGGERALNQAYSPEPRNTPHLLYRDASHGYAVATLTPGLWRTDYRAVSTVTSHRSEIRTLCSWVVENGRPGAVEA